jgi:predicted outer membrane protein
MLKQLAQAYLAEIALGKLAQEKAQSNEVKSFAKKMLDDHMKAQDELKQLAQSKGMSLPAEVDRQQQSVEKKLAALSGEKFDRQYMNHESTRALKDTHRLLERINSKAEDADLKSYASKTRVLIQDAFADTRYKLAATATPSPNDHTELGNHAEFLGVMRQQEMLSKWFINDTSTASQEWRLKGHAASDFWGFVASWSRCATLPSDLGGDDTGYILPDVVRKVHEVAADRMENIGQGMLFRIPEMSATSFHEEKRLTLRQRCELAAALVLEDFRAKLAESYVGVPVKVRSLLFPEVSSQVDVDPVWQGDPASKCRTNPVW